MAERSPSGGRAVGREHERAPARRRRRETPGLDPPLANGADPGATDVGKTAQYNDVAADLPKPKKKAKKKKKAQASIHGLEESPGRYAPGPAAPRVSTLDVPSEPWIRTPGLQAEVVGKNVDKKTGSDRGIETMYRSAYLTQLELTNLADNKANIMISINGLILSVILAAGGFVATLEPWLLLPVGTLVLTCIAALFFAVQAARPRLPKKTDLKPADFIAGRANVLFFQNFTVLPEEQYVEVMDEIMRDRRLTYHHMSRHLYGLGTGLTRKFNLLRSAYACFVIGIAFSSALFFIVYALSGPASQVTALAASPLAAAERSEDTPAFRELTGVYEPSAVHQLADGRFIVVEDEERHPIDLLTLQEDGGFSATAVYPKELFDKDGPAADFRKLDDLEGLDVDERGRVYALTSHSRSAKGKVKEEREKLVRFEVAGDALRDPRVVEDLKEQLSATHQVLNDAAAVDDVKDGNGLNIEGLAFDEAQERLLVGFRGPLVDGKAMLVAIENVDEMFETEAAPRISEQALLLDLGGEGIRGMTYVPRLGGFLVISGPLEQVENVPFRLWFWPGQADQPAQEVTVPGLAGFEHAEGITPVRWRGAERLLIVSDDGDMDAGEFAQYLMLDYDQLLIAAAPSTTQ
jgi:Family of unknown function (DUF5706)/Protein of unknown function (DUF3616)